MMEGGDERDRWEVGNGGEGGHGCSHDSLTPSFTVSQRIKCQTNQLSSKQTSTGMGHDGIYLPRVHINNIKKDIIRNRLSSNNVPTHTIKPLAITIICSLALYSVSPQPLGSLCCNSYCAWLMDDRQGLQGFGETAQQQLVVFMTTSPAAALTSHSQTPKHTYWLNLTLSYHRVWPKWPFQTH